MHKNIIALGGVSFFTDLSSAMITPILPIFLILILHQNVQTLGYTVAIATFVSYAFRILFGFLSDRYQVTKSFLVVGYLLSALSKPFLYFSSSWQSVASLRGLERMGKAIRSASKDKLISKFAAKNEHGKTFGFHKTMDIAGELFGAGIVFIILYFLGSGEMVFRNIFAFTIFPGILAVLILIFFVADTPKKSTFRKTKWQKSDNQFFPIFTIYFAFLFFLFGDSFFLLRPQIAGFSITFLPLLVMSSTLTQTFFSLFLGKKIDEFGAKKILFLGFCAGLLAIISLYLQFWISAFVLLGVFTVSTLNAVRTLISQKAQNKATVYGIFYAGTATATALGALLVGFLWQYYGVSSAFNFSLWGLVITIFFSTLLLFKK